MARQMAGRGGAFDDGGRAGHLASEKDNRPYESVLKRAHVLPFAQNPYTSQWSTLDDPKSWYNPSFFGGAGGATAKRMTDGVKDYALNGTPYYTGNTFEDTNAAGGDLAGLAVGMGGVFGRRPANSLGSSGRPAEPAAPTRSVDPLGYYSQALETAKGLQGKGQFEQMLATMRNKGVKQGEIDATGLGNAFQPGQTVSSADIVKHLTENRVGMKEVVREPYDLTNSNRQQNDAVTKFSSHSLDPSNPTYRETVLHLPPIGDGHGFFGKSGTWFSDNLAGDPNFVGGHFSEPNIVGHMMTSMTKHEGKPVYTIDQIQSDWGQRLRNGGVRDEAKIAELKVRVADADKLMGAVDRKGVSAVNTDELVRDLELAGRKADADIVRNRDLLRAELRTAEATSPGHPLVNTTDQWLNTVLRRGVRQAVDANADHIAIPSGKTVLGYNPGQEHGMEAFYNDIVPKNLGNILAKLDKAGGQRRAVPYLQTPSNAQAGQGFSMFEITPAMREAARRGMPLFANPPQAAAYGLLPRCDDDLLP